MTGSRTAGSTWTSPGSAAATRCPPADALRLFRRALGVPPGQVPADVDEQAALHRSLTAERALLVLLDNGRSRLLLHRKHYRDRLGINECGIAAAGGPPRRRGRP